MRVDKAGITNGNSCLEYQIDYSIESSESVDDKEIKSLK